MFPTGRKPGWSSCHRLTSTTAARAPTRQPISGQPGAERCGPGRGPTATCWCSWADAARYDELQFSIREYLAWKYVRDNADGALNLTAQQQRQ